MENKSQQEEYNLKDWARAQSWPCSVKTGRRDCPETISVVAIDYHSIQSLLSTQINLFLLVPFRLRRSV